MTTSLALTIPLCARTPLTLLEAMKTGNRNQSQEVLTARFGNLIIEALPLQGRRSHRGDKLRLLQDGVLKALNAGQNAHPAEDVRQAFLAS